MRMRTDFVLTIFLGMMLVASTPSAPTATFLPISHCFSSSTFSPISPRFSSSTFSPIFPRFSSPTFSPISPRFSSPPSPQFVSAPPPSPPFPPASSLPPSPPLPPATPSMEVSGVHEPVTVPATGNTVTNTVNVFNHGYKKHMILQIISIIILVVTFA